MIHQQLQLETCDTHLQINIDRTVLQDQLILIYTVSLYDGPLKDLRNLTMPLVVLLLHPSERLLSVLSMHPRDHTLYHSLRSYLRRDVRQAFGRILLVWLFHWDTDDCW